MRKLLVIAALALLPVASQAQFSLGLRLGFAPAMGDFEKDAKMSDGVKSQIPIQVDAMYKFTPELSAGLYGSYGIGQLNLDTCDLDGVDCSANAIRVGVQGVFTFAKLSPTYAPWIGAGIGWERASFTVERSSIKGETTATGFEFLNLQAGADYKVNEKFSVGPYLQFSIGQYSSVEGEEPVFDDLTGEYVGQAKFDADIEEKAMHEWFGFGIRGKFDL